MPPVQSSHVPARLHVGCGRHRLDGWINADIQLLPTVDVVFDAAGTWPLKEFDAIYAEHFLEHLRLDAAIAFLERSHRALRPGGWLRVSTPNLDWILSTHYDMRAAGEDAAINAVVLNRAFHGWAHQFAWNQSALEMCLRSVGFETIRWCGYGASVLPVFENVEGHEQYADSMDLPHVLIAEARRGLRREEDIRRIRAFVRDQFLAHLDPLPARMITGDDDPTP